MYSIKRVEYGFHLVFGGVMEVEEVQRWHDEFAAAALKIKTPFAVFVDMRTLTPLSDEAQVPMNEAQKIAREHGMTRSVVILKDNLTTLQFIRIARETGIYTTERYISAIDNEDWEQQGLAWILEGKEPAG